MVSRTFFFPSNSQIFHIFIEVTQSRHHRRGGWRRHGYREYPDDDWDDWNEDYYGPHGRRWGRHYYGRRYGVGPRGYVSGSGQQQQQQMSLFPTRRAGYSGAEPYEYEVRDSEDSMRGHYDGHRVQQEHFNTYSHLD